MNDTDVAAVRAAIEERMAAIRAGDAARANAVLAPDVVAFELVPPLALPPGAARDDTALAAWLASWEGPVAIETRDLAIRAGGGVAFAHALQCVGGTGLGGRPVRMWLRSTLCFEKREGAWLIVHAHSSVPFRPEDRQAALDLAP
jgi:ketosteroid isomerase-like protein